MLYLCTGKDVSSDKGYFNIIVEAKCKEDAMHSAKLLLLTKGRDELVNGLRLDKMLTLRPIVWEDVEQW